MLCSCFTLPVQWGTSKGSDAGPGAAVTWHHCHQPLLVCPTPLPQSKNIKATAAALMFLFNLLWAQGTSVGNPCFVGCSPFPFWAKHICYCHILTITCYLRPLNHTVADEDKQNMKTCSQHLQRSHTITKNGLPIHLILKCAKSRDWLFYLRIIFSPMAVLASSFVYAPVCVYFRCIFSSCYLTRGTCAYL